MLTVGTPPVGYGEGEITTVVSQHPGVTVGYTGVVTVGVGVKVPVVLRGGDKARASKEAFCIRIAAAKNLPESGIMISVKVKEVVGLDRLAIREKRPILISA